MFQFQNVNRHTQYLVCDISKVKEKYDFQNDTQRGLYHIYPPDEQLCKKEHCNIGDN